MKLSIEPVNITISTWYLQFDLQKTNYVQVYHSFPYTIWWSIAKVSNWFVLLGEHKVWNQSFILTHQCHPYINSPKLHAISMNQSILNLTISFCCIDFMRYMIRRNRQWLNSSLNQMVKPFWNGFTI